MSDQQNELDNLTLEEFHFGVKHRIYNWNMRIAREKLKLTQAQLGEAVGIGNQTIGHYETFRAFPKHERARKIAKVLGVAVSNIFPEWLEEFRLKQVSTTVTDEYISLEGAMQEGLITTASLLTEGGLEDVEYKIDSDIAHEKINQVLEILTPREKRVLELRFGLTGQPSMIYEEVGLILNVTRERIRQIEKTAIRRLRHPSRSISLRGLLDIALDY